MTQKDKILEYLEKNGSITQLEAFEYLHITALTARISELIKAGYNIKRTNVITKAGDKTKHFTRYEYEV